MMNDGGLKGYSGGRMMRPWYIPPCSDGVQSSTTQFSRLQAQTHPGYMKQMYLVHKVLPACLKFRVWRSTNGEMPLEDVVLESMAHVRVVQGLQNKAEARDSPPEPLP